MEIKDQKCEETNRLYKFVGVKKILEKIIFSTKESLRGSKPMVTFNGRDHFKLFKHIQYCSNEQKTLEKNLNERTKRKKNEFQKCLLTYNNKIQKLKSESYF